MHRRCIALSADSRAEQCVCCPRIVASTRTSKVERGIEAVRQAVQETIVPQSGEGGGLPPPRLRLPLRYESLLNASWRRGARRRRRRRCRILLRCARHEPCRLITTPSPLLLLLTRSNPSLLSLLGRQRAPVQVQRVAQHAQHGEVVADLPPAQPIMQSTTDTYI
jgi:hypothetical protein